MTNVWTAESTRSRHGDVWSLCRDGEAVVTCGSQERAKALVAERVEYDRITQEEHGIGTGWRSCAGRPNMLPGKPCAICGHWTHRL